MKNFWGFGPWKKSKKDSELKGKPRFAGFALLERLGKGGFKGDPARRPCLPRLLHAYRGARQTMPHGQ